MIDTGTICPFPLAFPRGLNTTSMGTNLTVADCTQTYAQWLGAEHDAFQAVLCVIAFVALFTMILRMYQLRQYAHKQHMRMRDLPSFNFFFFGLLFAFFFAVENLDVFAFQGWYPAELYYILDELVAASLIATAVVLVDFWVKLGRGIGNSGQGLNKYEIRFTIFAVFVNFLGWIIVGVLDYNNFYLYEAIKSFGAFLILTYFIFRSSFAVRALHKTLTHTSSADGTGTSTSPATRRAVRILVRKYSQFVLILITVVIALLANGFLALRLDTGMDWRWRVVVTEQYDAVQIVLRCVYMASVLVVLTSFKIPQARGGSQSAGGSAPDRTSRMLPKSPLFSSSSKKSVDGRVVAADESAVNPNYKKRSVFKSHGFNSSQADGPQEPDNTKVNF